MWRKVWGCLVLSLLLLCTHSESTHPARTAAMQNCEYGTVQAWHERSTLLPSLGVILYYTMCTVCMDTESLGVETTLHVTGVCVAMYYCTTKLHTLLNWFTVSNALSTLCLQCKIVFGSQAELREHRKVCSRSHNDSTSTTTPSPSQSDVEVLSDSESVASEDSYKPSPPNRSSSPSPVKSRSDAHIPGERQRRRGRRGKRASKSESSENIIRKEKQKKSKLPSEATLVTSSSSPAVHGTFHYSPLGLGEDDMGAGSVSFNVGSDSSDYSDDEEDLTYTSAEMAQLLSLNELDMHPYSGSSEGEEEEVESEGEGTHKVLEGREEGDTGRKKRQRNKKKQGQSGGAKGDTSVTHDFDRRSPLPHHRSPARSRQPEPVGLFWDIENCSVPLNKSAFGVAAKMRRVFFEGKREAEFMVVCDITKERKEITDSLNKAQVH